MWTTVGIVFVVIIIIILVVGALLKKSDELEIKNLNFPSNLLYLRIKYKKEYLDITTETGIDEESLIEFVAGTKNPTLVELDKLATMFRVTREELVYRDFKYENKDWYLNHDK